MLSAAGQTCLAVTLTAWRCSLHVVVIKAMCAASAMGDACMALCWKTKAMSSVGLVFQPTTLLVDVD